ncbi:MAG: beta-galactosidase, partial [Candidatus Omnitrophota bacterium]|nr:beta-galactosidase [Candidatus Omnitrophota bacterium]
MKEAGIEITRDWIDWQDMEPVKGQYNWLPMDKKVKAANQAGIEILGYFVHMPAWAKKKQKDLEPALPINQKYPPKNKGGQKPPLFNKKTKASDFCAPKDINDFKEFAKAVAERYNGKHGHGEMKYIGILNEVTIPEFFDFKNADYVLWLVNGYEAVKQGNPDAKVLIGSFVDPLFFLGLKPDPVAQKFIDKMLGNYSQYYDIVDFHSYSRSDVSITETTRYIKE